MKIAMLITILLLFLPASCQSQFNRQGGETSSESSTVQITAESDSAEPEGTTQNESGQACFVIDNSENPIQIHCTGRPGQDTVCGDQITANGVVNSVVTSADYGSCFNGTYLAEEKDHSASEYVLKPANPQKYGILTLGMEFSDLRMEAVFLHGESVKIKYDRHIEITNMNGEFEFLLSVDKLNGMMFEGQVLSITGQLSQKSKIVLEKEGQNLRLCADTTIQNLAVTILTHDGRKISVCESKGSGRDFQVTVKNGRAEIRGTEN